MFTICCHTPLGAEYFSRFGGWCLKNMAPVESKTFSCFESAQREACRLGRIYAKRQALRWKFKAVKLDEIK